MEKYSEKEKKLRAIKRLAQLFYDHWEEGRVGSSRVFEHVVPDDFIIIGQSINGGQYREHIVPCALIWDECIRMYERKCSISEVIDMIDKYLGIALITEQEAQRLNVDLKLKTSMPFGWSFGSGDALQRMSAAGIKITPNKILEGSVYE